MVRFLKQFQSNEKGQVLLIVLGVLAIGGLTIAGSLGYATTSLKGGQILREDTGGVYAAGAGVEYALWYLGEYGSEPADGQLAENINQMTVDIQTVVGDIYTLYFGGLSEPGNQYEKVSVSGNISWVEGNRYQYEITVTQTDESAQTIFLQEVGARIPVGYDYEDDSTTRSDVVSPPPAQDPVVTIDGLGADLLQWLWKDWGARPSLNGIGDTFVQTFYIEDIEGGGDPEGYYAWVIGDPTAIGIVGEITGASYTITATATRPESGRTTARIEAEVMIGVGVTNIVSWVILN